MLTTWSFERDDGILLEKRLALADVNTAEERIQRAVGWFHARGTAVADYSKAIEMDPMITDPYRGRAGAYCYKGEYDKAWKDVHQAQALGHPVNSKLLAKLRDASGRDE